MEHIKNISSLLDQTGLSERPGSLLYSGNETIRKGSYYFLGTNPGGHKDQITKQNNFDETTKEDKIKIQLHKEKKFFNEYFEGEWINSKTQLPELPGQHIHQRNIKKFFQDLNLDLKLILSTNLCFVRSTMEDTYEGSLTQDSKKCWKIHEYLLSVVQPKFIICNGSKSRNFIQKRMDIIDTIEPYQHKKTLYSSLHRGSLFLKDYNLTLKDLVLFSVPHMGYFTYYPESTVWFKDIIKTEFNITL